MPYLMSFWEFIHNCDIFYSSILRMSERFDLYGVLRCEVLHNVQFCMVFKSFHRKEAGFFE